MRHDRHNSRRRANVSQRRNGSSNVKSFRSNDNSRKCVKIRVRSRTRKQRLDLRQHLFVLNRSSNKNTNVQRRLSRSRSVLRPRLLRQKAVEAARARSPS